MDVGLHVLHARRTEMEVSKYSPVFKSLSYWIKQKPMIHLSQNFLSGQLWLPLPAENQCVQVEKYYETTKTLSKETGRNTSVKLKEIIIRERVDKT